MAHIYDVRFHTKVNNIFRIYRINVKAKNQKDAINCARELWSNRYEGRSKVPYQFHINAKRTSDEAVTDCFKVLDSAKRI